MHELGRHGVDFENDFFWFNVHALYRINKGSCLTRFYQAFFRFPGDQTAHSLTVVQKNIDPVALWCVADIFYPYMFQFSVLAVLFP